jgi:hypothetical protein
MGKTYHPRGQLVDGYRVREHPNYVIWASMKNRCCNPQEPQYKNYGGRGITYCQDWEHFENFCRDMGVRPSKDHTIDRIDNDKGYSPDNCRWATRTQQCLNRRKFSTNTTGITGVVVAPNGRFKARYDEGHVRYSLAGTFDTAENAGAARERLIARLVAGKSVNDLLERPARYDSTTKIKGITPHPKGGYLVRATRNKKRVYVGFFTTLDAAKEALQKWTDENKYKPNCEV